MTNTAPQNTEVTLDFITLLRNFTQTSIEALKSKSTVLTHTETHTDGKLESKYFLDFLRVSRNLTGHAKLSYAINLSNTDTPNYQENSCPKYQQVLDGKFEFVLIPNHSIDLPPLHSIIENGLDLVFTPEFDYGDLMLMALLQWSYKSIQDESERQEYLRQVNAINFQERLFTEYHDYQNGVAGQDCEIHKAFEEINQLLTVAHDLYIYREIKEMLDSNVVSLAESCVKGVFSYEVYRYLVDRLENHYKPNETRSVNNNRNATIIKLITNIDIDKADLPISHPMMIKIKGIDGFKLFDMLRTLKDEYKFNSHPETVATLLKLAAVYTEEESFKANEPLFPCSQLAAVKDAFDGFMELPNAEDLLENFVWLLHLITGSQFRHDPHSRLSQFALNYESIGKNSSMNSGNLELIGSWLNEDLLFAMYQDWVNDRQTQEPRLVRSDLKFPENKPLLMAVEKYNDQNPNIRIKLVQTGEDFLEIMDAYHLSKSPLFEKLIDGQAVAIRIRAELMPEHLAVIKINHDDPFGKKSMQIMGYHNFNDKTVKAKDQAFVLREVTKLNPIYAEMVSEQTFKRR